jgi:glutaminyl-tRNA synthetase
MSTIYAYRRKGYTASAINTFCEKIGVTRAPNHIPIELLELCCRLDLDPKVHRAMVVLKPLKVTITNFEGTEDTWVSVPNHPYEDKGTHKVPLTRVVYIERTDFRPVDEKGYYGLAPGKTALLKYAYNITCTDVVYNDKNEVVEIKVTMDKSNSVKVKGVLHWVAEGSHKVEVRLYDHLFKSENPNDLGADWLSDINPNSLEIIEDALADASLNDSKVGDRFQFERQGYFVVDPDSKPEKKVFNRTVTLKESKAKKTIAPTTAKAAAKPKAK